MWDIETSNGNETDKIRSRVIEYITGRLILDIGCGDNKIIPSAIGLDMHPKADLQFDLSLQDPLLLFNSSSVDVCYSSHFLEDLYDYKSILKEMDRVVKDGGYIILYLPLFGAYPAVGTEGANPSHKHNLIPEDILSKLPDYTVIVNEERTGTDEYSFLLVLQKTSKPRGLGVVETKNNKALVIRLGAFGDVIQTTPVFKLLKDDGYHVTLLTRPENINILRNDPNLDDVITLERTDIHPTKLDVYFEYLETQYDKVINLCEVVEYELLMFSKDIKEQKLSSEDIHKKCNVNYVDQLIKYSGFDVKGLNPTIYLTDKENILGNILRNNNKDTFNIQLQLSGSGLNKMYAYWVPLIDMLTRLNVKIWLSGGDFAHMFGVSSPKVVNKIGVWDIRTSCIMTKFMDLVIGPETGVLNACSAFNTPKICFLTHSSKENLTKYWINDHSIENKAKCYPCHRIISNKKDCLHIADFSLPYCMSEGLPHDLIYLRALNVMKNSNKAKLIYKDKIDDTQNGIRRLENGCMGERI